MTAVELACRAAIAVVLAAAAVGKLASPTTRRELATTMAAMGLPHAIATPLGAGAVAMAEAITVVALAFAPRAGYVLAVALVAGFTLGLVSALRRRAAVACHCFGAAAGPIGARHLVRNALLLAIAATGALAPTGDATWLAAIPGAIAGVAITAWDELAFALTSPATGSDRAARRIRAGHPTSHPPAPHPHPATAHTRRARDDRPARAPA
jgi:hypothetical protein